MKVKFQVAIALLTALAAFGAAEFSLYAFDILGGQQFPTVLAPIGGLISDAVTWGGQLLIVIAITGLPLAVGCCVSMWPNRITAVAIGWGIGVGGFILRQSFPFTGSLSNLALICGIFFLGEFYFVWMGVWLTKLSVKKQASADYS